MRLSLATTGGTAPYPRVTNRRTDHPEERLLGRALSVLRRRARLSQQAAAEAFGVTPQAWQNYEAGKRASAFSLMSLPALTGAVSARPEDLARVRDLLNAGISEALLADASQPLPSPGRTGEVIVFPATPGGSAQSREEALAPVYGVVHAGDPAAIAFTPDRPSDWKPLHPNQLGHRDPFYLEVLGDSLSPRFERGEYAPAVRGVWPTRGQVCVVETHEGAMLLKYFEGREPDGIRLRELQPEPRTFTIHARDIRAVHAVVGGAVY